MQVRYRVGRAVKMVIFVLLAAVIFGFGTEYLWNWLMPGLFGLHAITFWQALGLVVLGKILFGGVHRHGGGRGWRRGGWDRRFGQRWNQMSEEERARFRAGMRGRCGWGPRGGFAEDENAAGSAAAKGSV